MVSPELINRLERIEKLLLFNKKVLTIEEAADLTGYKPSYLYKLTSAKEIPHSKPNGGSIFFNKEKLESWMLQNEVKSKQDLESEALSYTLKNRKS
ncbi:helix-turn-helix domain-containing protein [Polaribacter butkevichii]|uniref:Excisionase n=1 Tax=Polaribacter butkevichii TaxID=218490 RepID=A0A2P6CD01_9FLAO|nr:helix-turn-helix domain-containing protein [Polaribacter butkevichii]PQJ72782.1 excisionase [Polaribacter butkevichii]